jgi:hypothetical protein
MAIADHWFGMTGTSAVKMLLGAWVNTIVLTRPMAEARRLRAKETVEGPMTIAEEQAFGKVCGHRMSMRVACNAHLHIKARVKRHMHILRPCMCIRPWPLVCL